MDHPHFMPHSDYRETFRLAEINDATCKLVIVADDGLEILRRALKCARKRQNWIDTEDENGYTTPDDSDWDDITSTLDDLEYQLMCACEKVVLDDKAVIQIENAAGPGSSVPSGGCLIASGAAAANRVLIVDGHNTLYLDVLPSLGLAEVSTYNWDTSGTFNLILQANGGAVGVHNTNPTYDLDVTGAARVTGAFGCNGQAPQTKYTVPADSTDLPTVIALCNALRKALGNVGITG